VTAAIATLHQVFLSRVRFGFVISFHIIFPAFTIEDLYRGKQFTDCGELVGETRKFATLG